MFCPQCGTESASELKYCRSCGANLKVIGKAVSLSEAINRSDGIPATHKPWWLAAHRERTPERRRERHLTRGFVSMFTGIGLGVFLYFLGHTVVLRLPPEAISKIPFDLNSLMRVLWLIGLIPTLSGFGRILAGLSIRATRITPVQQPLSIDPASSAFDTGTIRGNHSREEQPPTFVRESPASITDRTTNILEREIRKRHPDEMNR